jgi:hypothetical protein
MLNIEKQVLCWQSFLTFTLEPYNLIVMKKSRLFLGCFIALAVSLLSSCSNEVNDLSKGNYISSTPIEESSVALTNVFLNSLKNESRARSFSMLKYPEYFGGYYTNKETNRPVFKVVKSLSKEAKLDIERRISSPNFEIEFCENSYNSLNDVIQKLDEKFLDEKYAELRRSLGWVGYCIGMVENVIKVDLEDCSQSKINEFKEKVIDSPLIIFQVGSKIIAPTVKDSKPEDAVSKSPQELNPGQYINVPGRGEGSLCFPATQNGLEGFVTCGHVVETGMLVEGYPGMGTIGSCLQSIRGNTDVAFVQSSYNFSTLTAYGGKYLNLSTPVVLGVNDYVQKDGSTTLWTQGSVIDTGYRGTFDYDLGDYTVANLTVTNYKSSAGDSGGCVYSLTNCIAGMHMGADKAGTKHYYVVVDDIKYYLNVKL